MLIRISVLICLLISVISADVMAQKKITLEDAIQIALKQNIEVKKNSNDYAGLVRNKTAVRTDLLPKLDLTSEAYSATGQNFDEVTGTVRTATGYFANTYLGVRWNVLNIVNNRASLRIAENNVLSKEYDINGKKEAIVLNVLSRYLEILQNLKQNEIFEEFYAAQAKNLAMTEEFIKIGTRAGQDAYTQQAELSRLELVRLENINTINSKKNELLLFLNLPPGTEMELVDDSDYIKERENIEQEGVQLKKLYDSAMVGRNDLRSLDIEVEGRAFDIKKTKAANWPEINLFYNWGTTYSSFGASKFGDQIFRDNITSNYGLTLSLPIFNGFQTRNLVYQAEVTMKNAQLDVEQLRNRIYTQLSNADSGLKTNKQRKVFSLQQLEAAQMAYQLEQEKYQLGSGSPLDLTLAQRNFIEASLMLVQTEFQLIYSQLELEYFSGQLKF